ncbi:MAG TPA: hypothetical protein VJB36_12035 [Methylomirabilota bacterium]|nr:hypothetical protein [Methylomirabilota bacterium]
MGTVAKRERRSLWATLSLLLALGIGGCVFLAGSERSSATEAAEDEAMLAGEQLASMVTKKDLAGPLTGARHARLAGDIREAITARGPVDAVIVWSPQARVLFAADESLVGTRATDLRGLLDRVAEGFPESRIRGETLQTFIPMWPSTRGAVAMAEMRQTAETIAAAGGTWTLLRTILIVALVVTLLLFLLTLLPTHLPIPSLRRKRTAASDGQPQPDESGKRTAPSSNGQPQPDEGRRGPFRSRRSRREPTRADGSSPAYMHPGFRQLEESRQAAEERAVATEQNFHGLQSRFERTVDQVKVLEGRVQAEDATGQKLREMEARLQAAEARIKELEAAMGPSAPDAPARVSSPTTEQVR